MSYWVYILASKPFGTLYVGVTNDVVRRAYEHREGLIDGFTKEHGVKMLARSTQLLWKRFNAKRTSSTGHEHGRSTWCGK